METPNKKKYESSAVTPYNPHQSAVTYAQEPALLAKAQDASSLRAGRSQECGKLLGVKKQIEKYAPHMVVIPTPATSAEVQA